MMNTIGKNIFVIGDLVIDHTVFVQKSKSPHQKIANENVYQRFKRIDIAGGAANTARILAVVNPGQNILWGITGESFWGSFRSILETSQAIDGAAYNIEFRSVQDESNAKMNTITRIIEIGDPPNFDNPTFVVRYDDYGHIHVSDDKRKAVLHHLKRINVKNKLHAIIINDLDMGTLTEELVHEISEFANCNSIPLFVDPKRILKKYYNVQGTVIMPNLVEWCHLVGESDKADFWKKNLDDVTALKKLAQLSFHYLGNFRFHIIKCDEYGSILLAPSIEMKDHYSIYRLKPHETKKNKPPPQLGCGDVMVGILAQEATEDSLDTNSIIRGLIKANKVVAAYRDMPWQRMPSLSDIINLKTRDQNPDLKYKISTGMLFLPTEPIIHLSQYQTKVPELLSTYTSYSNSIDTILEDFREGWTARLLSIILIAGSGSGKSTLMKYLLKNGESKFNMGVHIIDPDKITFNKAKWKEELKGIVKTKGSNERLLIILDEAFKARYGKNLKTVGVELIDEAHKHNCRFLFIDTQHSMNNEFTCRCQIRNLPSLAERPKDVSLIIPQYLLSTHPEIESLNIEAYFLLSLTDATLLDANPKTLCTQTDQAFSIYSKREKNVSTVLLGSKDIPQGIKKEQFIDNHKIDKYLFLRS